jgi:hypothetical protein
VHHAAEDQHGRGEPDHRDGGDPPRRELEARHAGQQERRGADHELDEVCADHARVPRHASLDQHDDAHEEQKKRERQLEASAQKPCGFALVGEAEVRLGGPEALFAPRVRGIDWTCHPRFHRPSGVSA